MRQRRAEAIERIRHELGALERFRQIARDATGAAHELRLPLGSMALLLELELDDEPGPSARHDLLRKLLHECQRASAIVDELLERAARATAVEPSRQDQIDELCAPLAHRSLFERLLRRD